MTTCQRAARPVVHGIRQCREAAQLSRSFCRTAPRRDAVVQSSPAASTPTFDPATVISPKGERALMLQGIKPIGSRRRRAALRTAPNIAFEQLPYQCFQEARKVLQKDREEKIKAIELERQRITRLEAADGTQLAGRERQKQIRLDSMRRHLERLKILADINDPLIKKRFEDGEGDMSKPIYRYLADRKWRSYSRLLVQQRISQFSIVPDLLPHFETTADVRLAFGRRNVQTGEYVDSRVSEVLPRLKVQVFDKGERMITVIAVDADVPALETDGFTSRCHYLAANIPISPTQTSLPFSTVNKDSQLVLPWLPPFSQKGSPYHRISIFAIEQAPGQMMDISQLREKLKRDAFNLRSFVDRYKLRPIGMNLFRSTWDEGTAGVMQRAGVEGADVEFKRRRVEALKPKQKARGWEARHASDKYRSLRR